MTRSNVRKYLLPSIALVSGVSLAGGAWAADLVSDAQEQARELLAPTKVDRPITFASSARGTDYADPQELARRLLSGARSFGAEPTPAKIAAHGASTDHEDAQTLARRMILGAGGPTETRTASSVARYSAKIRSLRTP